MDQDYERTSKQNQYVVSTQWKNVQGQMEYIELIFEENCKLSQGDKSKYFFLKTSTISKIHKLNLPRQFNQNYYKGNISVSRRMEHQCSIPCLGHISGWRWELHHASIKTKYTKRS